MKIVGVTGSSGAGKSTVCKILEEKYQAEIIDADKIAKDLSKSGTMYFNAIVDAFGTEVVHKGNLNRKKLADIIYEDDEKRERLNKCTFGFIVKEIKKKINQLNHKEIIVIDAPLLFESDLDTICDFVIAVVSRKEEQVKRICERDNISEEDAIKRLNAQKSNEFLKEMADYILYNTDDYDSLEKEFDKSGIEDEFIG